MKLTTNMYIIAVTAAVVALGIIGVFGAGVVSGLGGWPEISNPLSRFQSSEPVVHNERPDIVHKVQSLSRLETSSYTIEKIVPANTSPAIANFLFGDEIMLIAHGHVIAGVDLSKIEEADIDIEDDDSVWVMLPPTEIFIAALNNEDTQVYDRSKGWFTRGDDQLETRARQDAEAMILDAACIDGILEHAGENAKTHLTAFLNLLGFKNITIISPVGECEPINSQE